MLDIQKIKAITFDLDDTLWPIGPTLMRAEKALQQWLLAHSPMTAALFNNPDAMHAVREQIYRLRPELKHDLSAVRREAIRLAMYRAKEDPLRAAEAFDVFFSARQKVHLYHDSLPSLKLLAKVFPLGVITNGNADVKLVGLGDYFGVTVSARELGKGKPHREVFELAAERLGVPTHAVLHVGDDRSLDVLGALNAGMQAVWVNRTEDDWALDAQPTLEVTDLYELCEALRGPTAFETTESST